MKMYPISSKIRILKGASLSRSTFINEEINDKAISQFICCNCGHETKIEITPYESGFPIYQTYYDEKVLSKTELLEKKILTQTSHWMEHYGELTHNDLPPLYFGINCENCQSKYFGVFCYGEKQPGLTLLEISGIWLFEFKDI